MKEEEKYSDRALTNETHVCIYPQRFVHEDKTTKDVYYSLTFPYIVSSIGWSTNRNTEVLKQQAGDEPVRIVVLVRWKQLTQQLSVNIAISGSSQVVRKTWMDF